MNDHKHESYEVYGVAEDHHRHSDTERMIAGLREDLGRLESRVSELEELLEETRRSVNV